jgi:peptide-methionine (S)-S-oxide reductase
VVRTRVGYAGGTRENPTYHHLGDHAETLQIDYDPERISFERLLEYFWSEHDPTSRAWSTQYKAVVFYHSDDQKRLAEESRDRLAAKLKRRVFTEVTPFSRFYPAEAYHQKYYLRQNRRLLQEMQRYYMQDAKLMNSTAAARVNGYLGRFGTAEGLKVEIDRLGLSEDARRELQETVGAGS